MIKREDVYKIGRLGKAHGVKGEISFQFDDDIFDTTDADYLIIEIDDILVPFFMEEYRFRNDNLALVKFCRIDTQEKASELTGCDVYFPRQLAEDTGEIPSLSMLIGYQIINAVTQEKVGTIAGIDDQTANILFELEEGLLIPASDELIRHIDVQHQEIIMNIPQGLLEL